MKKVQYLPFIDSSLNECLHENEIIEAVFPVRVKIRPNIIKQYIQWGINKEQVLNFFFIKLSPPSI